MDTPYYVTAARYIHNPMRGYPDWSKTIPCVLVLGHLWLGNGKSNIVKLEHSDAANRIDITTTGKDGAIKYNEAGVYFIIGCAQTGSAIDTSESGDVHLWMRLNNEDVPNSNTIQTIRKGSTAVPVSQTIIKLEANDRIQLIFSTTDNKLGMIASTPKLEPAVPSMIVSTFRLRNTGGPIPYSQLSSSRSQWGCITPKAVELDNDDGSQRIKNSNGIIEFRESGTYFVIAAGQIASDEGTGIGDLHLWMQLNGKDMGNSNTIQSVNGDTAVLICQTAIEIEIGDQLKVMFSTDVTAGKIGLVATKPENEPLVPIA